MSTNDKEVDAALVLLREVLYQRFPAMLHENYQKAFMRLQGHGPRSSDEVRARLVNALRLDGFTIRDVIAILLNVPADWQQTH